jgi:uncharacterized membrane-anchored protein YhcB (DUF1043 family)
MAEELQQEIEHNRQKLEEYRRQMKKEQSDGKFH